jgi:hypothetical protein
MHYTVFGWSSLPFFRCKTSSRFHRNSPSPFLSARSMLFRSLYVPKNWWMGHLGLLLWRLDLITWSFWPCTAHYPPTPILLHHSWGGWLYCKVGRQSYSSQFNLHCLCKTRRGLCASMLYPDIHDRAWSVLKRSIISCLKYPHFYSSFPITILQGVAYSLSCFSFMVGFLDAFRLLTSHLVRYLDCFVTAYSFSLSHLPFGSFPFQKISYFDSQLVSISVISCSSNNLSQCR